MEDNEALLEMLTSVTVSKQGSRGLHSSEGRREAAVRDLQSTSTALQCQDYHKN